MNATFSSRLKNSDTYRWLFLLLVGALLISSFIYLSSTWNFYLAEADEKAISVARSASHFLSTTRDNEVQQLNEALTRFVEQDSQISRAYIYTLEAGEIQPLADTQTSDLARNDLEMVSEPRLVRGDNLVHVFVPIIDLQSDAVLAVLAVDFSATAWYQEAFKHMIHALIVVVLIALFLLSGYWLIKKNLELRESERSKAVLLSHLPGMAYRCKNDADWTMLFVSAGCQELTGYAAESLVGNQVLSYNEIINPKHRDRIREEWERVLATQTSFRADYEITTATGERKWVLEMGQGIYDQQGEAEALEGLIIDITEQKIQGQRIRYMKEHDLLTGVYNRDFYEQTKKQFSKEPSLYPLSIIVADVMGLKIINGAFGNRAGDQLIVAAADIIRANSRPQDILARTEGDTFRLLLPRTREEEANKIMEAMLRAIETYNTGSTASNTLNMLVVAGTAEGRQTSMDELESQIEEDLHQRKLISQAISHRTMLSSIMVALYARSEETKEHCQRMATLATMIGEKLNLPQKNLDELELIAMLHDIGKIGIDDRVLKKPGKLNHEDWALMKRHPEIGYRIAMSSKDLEPIAPYILTHHERWDGKGYPKGLQGEEIPLLSRIIAIVDAYDAMTKDRIYRKAMTEDDALEEIERNAGTQFDPSIAQLFVDMMRNPTERMRLG